MAALKEFTKFIKAAGLGKTKGGLMGNVVLSPEEVERLSKLPGREALLGKLVGQLNAPIQSLHYALQWNINKLVWALNGIKNTKQS